MKFNNLILLLCVSNTSAFHSIVVGSGVSSKIASISLARKGHSVKLVDPVQSRVGDMENVNYILTESDMKILNNYNIPYTKRSISSDHLINHYRDDNPVSIGFDHTCSISRRNLLEIIDNIIKENPNIQVDNGYFEGSDFNKNICYLSSGSEKYDLLVAADGINSKVRSKLEEFSSEDFSFCQYEDQSYKYKNFKLDNGEVKKLRGYSDLWIKSIHSWSSKYCNIVASPTSDGGLKGHVICSGTVCDFYDFPDILNSIDPRNLLKFDRSFSNRKKITSLCRNSFKNVLFIGEACNSFLYENLRFTLEDCALMDHCLSFNNDPLDICNIYHGIKIKQKRLPRFKLPML